MLVLVAIITIWAGANSQWWLSGSMLAITVALGYLEVREERRAAERDAQRTEAEMW